MFQMSQCHELSKMIQIHFCAAPFVRVRVAVCCDGGSTAEHAVYSITRYIDKIYELSWYNQFVLYLTKLYNAHRKKIQNNLKKTKKIIYIFGRNYHV